MNKALLDLDKLSEELKSSSLIKHNLKSTNSTVAKKKGKQSRDNTNGTGYGGSSGAISGQNRSKAFKNQSVEDDKLEMVLKLLGETVEKQSYNSSGNMLESLLNSPGLRWIIKYLLVNDSLLDIGSRPGVYHSLLELMKIFSNEPFAAPFLNTVPSDEEHSACYLLKILAQQAKTFLLLYQNQEDEQTDGDDETLSAALMMAIDLTEAYSSVTQGCLNSNMLGILSSKSPVASEAVVQSSSSSSKRGKRKLEDDNEAAKSAAETSKEEKAYLEALRPLRFEAIALCDLVETHASQHSFLGANAAQYLKQTSGHSGVVGDARKRLARVACEMSGLSSSLPVEVGSSIFVRCDESRMDVLKALIVGPEGTPYANGLFEFDILLPPGYPSVPPQVKLVTTGGGTVRFNPNLYNCGKVCLSLLGTWAGPGWDPLESTLLQVLVSIQSLILVPDPYFNEPGWQSSQNTPAGKQASDVYNANIRIQTLRFGILGGMQKPSVVFADVALKHFYFKRRAIAAQLEEWGERSMSDKKHPKHAASVSAASAASTVEQLVSAAEIALTEVVMRYEAQISNSSSSSSRSDKGSGGVVIDLQEEEEEEVEEVEKQKKQRFSASSAERECIVID